MQKNQAKLLRSKSIRAHLKAKKSENEADDASENPKPSPSIPTAAQVRAWGVDQVSDYFSNQTFVPFPSESINAFRENEIDGVTVLALTYDDLTEDLGIDDEAFVRSLLVHISEIHEMM